MPTYRRRLDTSTWHWHRNCSKYPHSNYESEYHTDEAPRGTLCIECRGKETSKASQLARAQLMFLWSCEKLKIELLSYSCDCTGVVVEYLDRTSTFTQMTLHPQIQVKGCSKDDVIRAISLARKYSLIAKSITAEVHIEPQIHIVS